MSTFEFRKEVVSDLLVTCCFLSPKSSERQQEEEHHVGQQLRGLVTWQKGGQHQPNREAFSGMRRLFH